jgi:hypothetical protein
MQDNGQEVADFMAFSVKGGKSRLRKPRVEGRFAPEPNRLSPVLPASGKSGRM